VLSSTNGFQRVLPVNRHGEFLIDWRIKANDHRRLTQYAFEAVLSDHLLRQTGANVTPRFRDKLVIVGSIAGGVELGDRGATPLDKDTFLTSNYWNVLNSVITSRFIRVTPRWFDVLLICTVGALASVLTRRLSTGRASISALLLATTYVGVAAGLFVFPRFWVPLVAPLLSLAAGYVGLVAYQAFFEETEKRRIRDVFSKFVSPTVVQKLLKSSAVSLTGERRQVTVLFADIRGFTETTDASHARAEERIRREKLGGAEAEEAFDRESQEVLNTVNLYLSTIADTVKNHGGTLDKFIGDCVMAFWGAPLDDESHAVSCVRAAIEAQRALHRLNEERRQENARRERANFEKLALGQTMSLVPMLQILSVGTGINTGTVVAGLMGSQDAHNYTIFGRDVNVASRLENLSGSARILIGEATYTELKKHDPALAETCIELPPTEIRGIREAIRIYEVPWK
jgi:adenylate cyclase